MTQLMLKLAKTNWQTEVDEEAAGLILTGMQKDDAALQAVSNVSERRRAKDVAEGGS